MTWRLAKSLNTLRDQINAQYPGRNKSSDGTIGDAAHASRSSDHNPWVRDGATGVVTACDISHDPANGVDAGVFANLLVASRDPRIKYIIWNRQIVSSETSPWQWRRYTGSNPHNKHVHISVKSSKALYDDDRPWAMPGGVDPVKFSASAPPPARSTIMLGSNGSDVRELQRLLGFSEREQDGMFGPRTDTALRAFQGKRKLVIDGKAGPYTWAALGR